MRRITLPRRRTRTVLWGGRAIDRQVGSSLDRYLRRLETRRALRERRDSPLVAELDRVSASIARLGLTTAQAFENVLALAEADRRRQERLRAAGRRAERALGGLNRDQARALLGLPRVER